MTYEKKGGEATFEMSTTGSWAAIGFSSDAMMVRGFFLKINRVFQGDCLLSLLLMR